MMIATRRMATRRILLLLVLAAVASLVVAAVGSRSGHTAQAATINMKGVTAADFAAQGFTLDNPTSDASVTEANAQAIANKAMDGAAVDTQLADCSQIRHWSGRLCWVVISDPKGDQMVAHGSFNQKVYAVDYEFTLVDAKTGDMIVSVQHAPADAVVDSGGSTSP
jgi:hypothetical protein